MSLRPQTRPDSLGSIASDGGRLNRSERQSLARTATVAARVACDVSIEYKAAHGFSVGQVVKRVGGTWALAIADLTSAISDADALALVVQVRSPDCFVACYRGLWDYPGHTLSSGWQYLSAATAGALTTTPPLPTPPSRVVQCCYVAGSSAPILVDFALLPRRDLTATVYSATGSHSATAPAGAVRARVHLVGGGAGGELYASPDSGRGGGAGAMVYADIVAQNLSIWVGAAGTVGNPGVASTVTATGVSLSAGGGAVGGLGGTPAITVPAGSESAGYCGQTGQGATRRAVYPLGGAGWALGSSACGAGGRGDNPSGSGAQAGANGAVEVVWEYF